MDDPSGFENLVAWQKARVLAREVYKSTRSVKFSKDYSLVDQIRRASTSVMSNIAEGFERGSRAEFHQALVVSKGSCGEVRSQLYLAFDIGYLDDADFHALHRLAREVGKVIGGLQREVKKQRDTRKVSPEK